jgi:two-component system phosphate regulon response regulator PhoB
MACLPGRRPVAATRRILIVDDHKPLRSLLAFLLGNAGYETAEAINAGQARDAAERNPPDLVLLDWRLPDTDGIAVLRRWREEPATAELPVIMMSGESSEGDRVTGLRAGADDYLVKPFGKDELLARVEAVLRRTGGTRDADGDLRRCGGIVIDTRSLRVTAAGRPVHVGPIEFRMLNLFVTNPERVLTRTQIVDRVWRVNAHVDERTVDVHVRRLRNALAAGGLDACIQTVRGVGYRMSPAAGDAGAQRPPAAERSAAR